MLQLLALFGSVTTTSAMITCSLVGCFCRQSAGKRKSIHFQQEKRWVTIKSAKGSSVAKSNTTADSTELSDRSMDPRLKRPRKESMESPARSKRLLSARPCSDLGQATQSESDVTQSLEHDKSVIVVSSAPTNPTIIHTSAQVVAQSNIASKTSHLDHVTQSSVESIN